MSTQTNKAITRRHIEQVWNQGRLDLYDELFAENVINHDSVQIAPGLEGMKKGRAMLQIAFPDAHFTIEHEVAEGDLVVIQATLRGTHLGDLMEMPPTGKKFSQSGVTIYRLDNARIVEVWFYFDHASIYRQLGIPSILEAPKEAVL